MRNILSIILILLSVSANATIWWVSPSGDNSNSGTDSTSTNAWATWGKAFNSGYVQAGDTVYFRAGTYDKILTDSSGWYYPSRTSDGTGINISNYGTSDNWNLYSTSPYDLSQGNRAILECRGLYDADSPYNYGIRTGAVEYVKFYGLEVRGVRLEATSVLEATGWKMSGNYIIENCVVHDIGGTGLQVNSNITTEGEYSWVINCDVYDCCDSASLALPGNDGYGVEVMDGANMYFKGCRSWLCGDYGFSTLIYEEGDGNQYVVFDSCWSFNNGMLDGVGFGWAMGWFQSTDGNLKRTYNHCIGSFNKVAAFFSLDYKRPYAGYWNVYNTIAYHNGYQGARYNGSTDVGYFIQLDNTLDADTGEYKRVIRNSTSFDNEGGDVLFGDGSEEYAIYTHSNNTWDGVGTVTAADFSKTLDSASVYAELIAPRQADGSLPEMTYFQLAQGSDLIDAGVDVGLPYLGLAPDIGAYESYPPLPAPAVGYKLTGGDGKILTDGNGKRIIGR